MKSLLCRAALTAAAFVVTSPLYAQSLNITAPGYSATPLFQTTNNFTLGGLAFDGSGNAYYIENNADFSNPTPPAPVLYRRLASNGYSTAVPLYTLSDPFAYGSFVSFSGGKVIFGDGNGSLRAFNPADNSVDLLGSVANNYDARVFGGKLFVSHNIETNFSNAPKNRVSGFNLDSDGSGGLMLGTGHFIVSADNDYSGPLEFDAAGKLYYGASGAYDTNPVFGLYGFDATEVQNAFSGAALTLQGGNLKVSGSKNTALAFAGDGKLWQDRFDGQLNLVDLNTNQVQQIATSPNNPGPMQVVNGTLNVGVSTFTRSTVFAVVPEPATAGLLVIGALGLQLRRRR